MMRLSAICWLTLYAVTGGILFFGFSQRMLALQDSNAQTSFDQIASQAAAAREAGHADEAVRFYSAAVKIRPDWDEGWWYLGTLNYDLNRYAEAIPALQHLLQLHPQIGAALAFLGLCEFETKDYDSSLADLQQAQQLGFAENPEIRRVAVYHLALLENRVGEFDKATGLLTAEFTQNDVPEQVKIALGLALLHVPLLPAQVNPSRDALLRSAGEASVLIAKKSFGPAATALQQLVEIYPDTAFLHYACGNVLLDASRYEEATLQFNEEARFRPKDPLPYIRLADIALRQHQLDRALRSAQHAVELPPQLSAAHDALAQVLKESGKTSEAAKETDIAAKLATRPPQVDAEIARTYAMTAASETTATPPTTVATASAGNFNQLIAQARAAAQAGQTDLASDDYKQALKLRPDWEEGWRLLGTLDYDSGHYKEAASALKAAASLEPKHGEVWALLGLSEFELKDFQNALIHLERGHDLGLAGNQTAVRIAEYHSAILLNLNGEFDKAMDLLLPNAGSGPMADQISFALGLSLLRIPELPDQIEPSKQALVRSAGEAVTFLSQSKYEQAFPIFQQLLKDNPDTLFLHYAYGSALASLSQYDEAAAQLREEIRISPASALPYLRLASMYLRKHSADEALSNAQHAVELAPGSAEAHYLLGRTLLELGKIPESVHELEQARQLAPGSPEVHFSLARAYAKAKRTDDAEQERESFERLNALVQEQKNVRGGNQTLGASSNQTGLSSAESESKPASPN
jgi:tetratricopeptide (TPR) repeat protein